MPTDSNTNEARKLVNRSEVLSLKALSVVVIDSSVFTLRLMGYILKALGVGKVMTVNNADDAISLLTIASNLSDESGRNTDVDMILCDLDPEHGGGQKLVKFIRSHSKDKIRFIPVVMMSGYAESRQVEQSRDWGANEFLSKPFSVNTIAARILAVIDRPRPFVQNDDFFGPDRRRKKLTYFGEERRHLGDDGVKVVHEQE